MIYFARKATLSNKDTGSFYNASACTFILNLDKGLGKLLGGDYLVLHGFAL